ncbi:ABC transporter ATP-binding protein [Virgibacillus sp. W0181]|uniref:ABC transporter ATP-binding protein n=1 Tax=Virgibacillus sp. W0181 TaxID=3391581 RepID=UPI003F45A299
MLQAKTPLLEVKDFALTFRQFERGLREAELTVIHKLNFLIHEGEIVAVVGASGSGKSLLADAILGILPNHAETTGTLNYRGKPLTKNRQKKLRGKEISLIPQSVNALDPLMKTGKQVETTIHTKNKRVTQQAIFNKVGLGKEVGDKYPFELSGGMQRRVLAATVLGTESKLIIADEPTPGLDPKSLAETVHEMKRLVTRDKAMMLITHDIDVALQLANKIVVFNEGKTIEVASVEQFTNEGERLQHPYTKVLWNALPQNNFTAPKKSVQGDIKNMSLQQSPRELVVKQLSYKYPNSTFLFKDLDLTLKSGEVVGLFGTSGSGKSTLAQIMSGYKQQVMGKVTIDGGEIPVRSVHPVQLIGQHPERVINPRWRMRRMLEEVGEIDMELIQALGIKETWLSRWPSELSGGELQRFCLARALTGEVEFLIADEITTMLDAVTQAEIWQTALHITKTRNIGVLAISHDVHLLNRISDRTIDFAEIT